MLSQTISHDLKDAIRRAYRPSGPLHQRVPCPSCSPQRRPGHRSEPVLALTEGDMDGVLLFSCKHCGIEGGIRLHPEEGRVDHRQLKPAEPRRLTVVSPPAPPSVLSGGLNLEPMTTGAVSYLMERGISEETAAYAGVGSKTLRLREKDGSSQSRETLVFPYAVQGTVYAGKARAIDAKLFTQLGSASTLWLGDQAVPGEDLIIVEGEVDALSIREAGHASVVSVPGGAPVKVSIKEIHPEDDRKYQFIWQGKEILEAAARVIIATDNDAPGKALGEEIARRWGKARSWMIEWPEGCKDANDVLVKHGADKLKEIIANPKPWPIEGVYSAKDYEDKVAALYGTGLGKGADPGMGLDEIYTLSPGMLTVVTGIPGSGKSSVFNQIMVNMAVNHGWRSAIFSSETPPELHIPILSAMYVGKPFFSGPTPRMTKDELQAGINWCNDYFLFLHSDNTPSYQEIIERLEVAVMRYGIRIAVVDPVNYLRKSEQADPVEWVGEMLEAFRSFGQSHGVHFIVIAHPKKMEPGQLPTGYSISGSAHYFNRADHGITIHRSDENRAVTKVVCWKTRWSWLGHEGTVELFYDGPTGRFSDNPSFASSTISTACSSTDPWEL